MKTIKVVELFAGVGGFRLGLCGWNGNSCTTNYKEKINSNFEVVWSNQWEPSTKTQHASMVYENRFGKLNHSNTDIASVDVTDIPDHDLLVGGFPCQDYSVATSLKNSKGLVGKKGVLWWSIYNILLNKKQKPKYLFLENVDRLLISPSKQRGRDFAIILKSLNDLGYIVEWRVINAADFGFPQRRKRVFILAYLKETSIAKKIIQKPQDWITKNGTISSVFGLLYDEKKINSFLLNEDIVEISNNFNLNSNLNMFQNTGVMMNGKVITLRATPLYEGRRIVLKDLLLNGEVTEEFYIDESQLDKWLYLKGAKKAKRVNSLGFEYNYSEGAMVFPDDIERPSRTIITGEGGSSPSRFKHVISVKNGYRRLSPIELERLNMFPDDFTKLEGISDTKRAFFMGNALVVGVIEKIALSLAKKIK
jgi:DNA (cytosine-5)-methyltransferase 1